MNKKSKPTFDVAHDPVPQTRSGWVYRSDAPKPAASAPAPGAGPIVVDLPAVREAPPSPPPPAPESQSWLATGFYLMTLPVRLSVSIMFAPINWMFGSRSNH